MLLDTFEKNAASVCILYISASMNELHIKFTCIFHSINNTANVF